MLWLATGIAVISAATQVARPPDDEMHYPHAEGFDVDLRTLEPGSSVTVKWKGERVTIRHRTQREIAAARSVDVGTLRDAQDDQDRTKPGRDEWLIVVAKCTHKGCVPVNEAGDFGGWFCPCHGSTYDTSGRIRSGPAPRNLAIPPYEFRGDTLVRLG